MKVLKMVLIACSLSTAAAAYAQAAPAAPEQQVAQADSQHADNVVARKRAEAPKAKADECVGPMSFCNIYFGS
jgi:Ni/Co efflux regulator RcnB